MVSENNELPKTLGVDKLGIADEVLEMYEKSISPHAMSMAFRAKGVTVSQKAISNWLKKRFGDTKKNEIIQKNFEVMCINYQSEITAILEEVKGVKELARTSGDLEIYVKLVGKLYQGLELLAKLMGDIKPNNSVDINILINEISKESFDRNKGQRQRLFNKSHEIIDVESEVLDGEEYE